MLDGRTTHDALRTVSNAPGGPPHTSRYRWRCPRCDASGGRLFVRGTGGPGGASERVRFESQVANDLESHLRSAAGGGHGPTGSRPRDGDLEDLVEYVERCDPVHVEEGR